ncbi:hypothetical protein [Psychromonas algicola]|uniref:hypothetical protein n=1 Tax=Psychromonas algicola TaxID=2555642 RepID=UPI00106795CE|nr:hypothetical protein [Psychromonas sp. RZ5]TEW50703.1 hypothetical protein E2R67_08860 [Psychromonas sp. RZ5]
MSNRNIKDFTILGVGKALQVLIGLGSLRLITELLSESEVGIYYILLTVVNLLAFACFNPLGQFYSRHLVHWKQKNNIKTATNVMLVLRGAAIPVAAILSIFIFYLFDYEQYFSLMSYVFFIIISLVALVHGVFLSAANVLVSRITFTIFSVSTLLVSLIASLLLFSLFQSAMAWLYGAVLVQIIFSLLLYRVLVSKSVFSLDKAKLAFNKEYLIKVFLFILPVTFTLFLQWGQTASFRLILEHLYSAKILAFISVGLALSNSIFSALDSLATQFYMPLYLKKITNATKSDRALIWNQLANSMFSIYIGVTIYVIVFSPYLAKLLVSENFYEAYIYTMIGAVIELFRVSTNLIYMVSQSEVKTKNTIGPYFFGFLIMIIGLYSIDVSKDLWKVPVILAFSYLITLLTMFLSMKKLLNIKLNFSIIVKSILFMSPLLFFSFIESAPTMSNSIGWLIIGGLYFLLIQYFLLKNKIQIMSLK